MKRKKKRGRSASASRKFIVAATQIDEKFVKMG